MTAAVPVAPCVGVPVIAPVELLMDNPVGRPAALKAYGVIPPDAARTALYADPTVPPGRDVVVIASLAAVTVRLRLAVAEWGEGCVESVTVIVTDTVPTVFCAGVPVIAPVGPPIESPAGKPLAPKVYGLLPPDTETDAL